MRNIMSMKFGMTEAGQEMRLTSSHMLVEAVMASLATLAVDLLDDWAPLWDDGRDSRWHYCFGYDLAMVVFGRNPRYGRVDDVDYEVMLSVRDKLRDRVAFIAKAVAGDAGVEFARNILDEEKV